MAKYHISIFGLLFLVSTIFFSTMAQNYTPEQIRLELTGTDSQMNVIYTTGSNSNSDYKVYTTPPSAYIWYGTSPTTLTKKIKGNTKRYEYSGYQADIHVITMTALTADTVYYYKIGDDTKPNGLSTTRQFKAGPPKTWAIYGDYGLTNMERAFTSLLTAANSGKEFDGIMHLGDIAYDLHNQKGAKGDIFMRTLDPVTSRYPYMTVAGNHESNGNFSHYQARFRSLEMLGEKSNSNTMLWYSWEAPNVHFLAFDTEVYSYFNDPVQVARQLTWLEADLKKANTAANRKARPWIITLGHKCDWQDEVKFDDFRALFHKYGVDLHICGHQHNYQRLYPGLKKTLDVQTSPNHFYNPKYWTQMVIGSPGCQEKISSGLAPYKGGVANYFLSYGYGLLTIHNATHLTWQWKQTSLPDSSANGETLFDQAVLAMQTQEMKAMNSKVGDEIKDYMTLVQTAHGMRDITLLEDALANSAKIEEMEDILYNTRQKRYDGSSADGSAFNPKIFGALSAQVGNDDNHQDGIDYNDPLWGLYEQPGSRPVYDPLQEDEHS